jgi:hypothetical protein
MSDAFVEFTEKPLVSRRQDDDMPTRPNPSSRSFDLMPVVLNVFENV